MSKDDEVSKEPDYDEDKDQLEGKQEGGTGKIPDYKQKLQQIKSSEHHRL